MAKGIRGGVNVILFASSSSFVNFAEEII